MSLEKRYKIYYIVSEDSNWYYIGMTSLSIPARFNAHVRSMKRGVKSPLYDHMRKHKVFPLLVLDELSHAEACEKEMELINEAKNNRHKILNLAPGGIGGFAVQDKASWKKKLSIARKGKTPFLRHKHTNETKERCKKASINFWNNARLFSSEDLIGLSFKEAKEKFGISKTHFYRLKNNAQT